MKLTGSYSKVAPRYSATLEQTVNRWTLMLPGAGCEYYKNTGGCTMCGFYQANKRYSFGLVYPPAIFKAMYWAAEKEIIYSQPRELFLYNGGSFFNPRELPADFRSYLFKAVRQHPSLERVMVESRIEYLNPRMIQETAAILGDKKLMIGIGLESKDNRVRNRLIRKGLSRSGFEAAVLTSQEAGAQVLAYVFLKPLGLSEAEALEDTWQTIEYCQILGVDEIEVSCAFIQPDTKMAAAYAKGAYSPPNLWTITELIKRARDAGLIISIGSFSDEPPPIAIPRNYCQDDCSPQIYSLIEDYRRTGRFDFSDLPDCTCRPKSKIF